jgi:hypothetical protein
VAASEKDDVKILCDWREGQVYKRAFAWQKNSEEERGKIFASRPPAIRISSPPGHYAFEERCLVLASRLIRPGGAG